MFIKDLLRLRVVKKSIGSGSQPLGIHGRSFLKNVNIKIPNLKASFSSSNDHFSFFKKKHLHLESQKEKKQLHFDLKFSMDSQPNNSMIISIPLMIVFLLPDFDVFILSFLLVPADRHWPWNQIKKVCLHDKNQIEHNKAPTTKTENAARKDRKKKVTRNLLKK